DWPVAGRGPRRQSRGLLHCGRHRCPARLARRVRNSRLVRIDRDDRGVLRLPRRGDATAGAFQPRDSNGQFPRHFCRPTRQGLLHIRILRSSLALLLLAIGEARASIAGLLIAAFAMGGVFYSLSVPVLIARVRERHLMVAGGALAATGLVLIALHVPWMWQIAIYGMFGFGFYFLHGCIQVHVTELSQTARGAAAS